MQAQIDKNAFRNFERDAHDRIAGSYNGLFAAVTDGAIAPVLGAAQLNAGMRLLDVAAGPGRLTRAAADRGALAVGCDLAPAMVALARDLNPGIRFDEASADALPYPAGSFDAVVCAFGIGHFPDPERVLAEFARVVVPGGRVALSWWEVFSRNRINGIFHEVIAKLGVSAPDVLLRPASPHEFRAVGGIRRCPGRIGGLRAPSRRRRSIVEFGDGQLRACVIADPCTERAHAADDPRGRYRGGRATCPT
jgi:SAM-dependent methyltransferase